MSVRSLAWISGHENVVPCLRRCNRETSFWFHIEILKWKCSSRHDARWAAHKLQDHCSPFTHWAVKAKRYARQVSSAFWGKRLQGAFPAPRVPGRLSVLKGMVGDEWEQKGNSPFRGFPSQLPRACLLASLELQSFFSSFRPNSSCCSITKLCLTLYDPL